jgi:hypothetical protein
LADSGYLKNRDAVASSSISGWAENSHTVALRLLRDIFRLFFRIRRRGISWSKAELVRFRPMRSRGSVTSADKYLNQPNHLLYSEFSANLDGSCHTSSHNSFWHELFIAIGGKKITFGLELLSNSSNIIGFWLFTSNSKECKNCIIIRERLHNIIGSLTFSQNLTTRIHTDSTTNKYLKSKQLRAESRFRFNRLKFHQIAPSPRQKHLYFLNPSNLISIAPPLRPLSTP